MKTNIYVKLIIAIIILSGCAKDGNTVNPPVEEAELNVMSFNLRYDNEEDGEHKWDFRKAACIDMFHEKMPSLIGVQEALYPQVNYLDENLTAYDYVGVGRKDGIAEGEYAAIFYLKERFTLLDHGTFWLSETPNEPSIGWDAVIERIVTWVLLMDADSGESVYLFNTHFDHQGSEARTKSALLLISKIKELTNDDSIVFVTGDFNGIISQSMFEPILDVFHNAQQTAIETDSVGSFEYLGLIRVNIDFIFHSRNVQAIKYDTVDDDYGVPYISDHYPIISSFRY